MVFHSSMVFWVASNAFSPASTSFQEMLLPCFAAVSSAYLWHPYGRSVIGNRADIEHVPIDKLQAFYKKFYQPDNAVLTVSGKIDEVKLLPLISDAFGPIAAPGRTLDQAAQTMGDHATTFSSQHQTLEQLPPFPVAKTQTDVKQLSTDLAGLSSVISAMIAAEVSQYPQYKRQINAQIPVVSRDIGVLGDDLKGY